MYVVSTAHYSFDYEGPPSVCELCNRSIGGGEEVLHHDKHGWCCAKCVEEDERKETLKYQEEYVEWELTPRWRKVAYTIGTCFRRIGRTVHLELRDMWRSLGYTLKYR